MYMIVYRIRGLRRHPKLLTVVCGEVTSHATVDRAPCDADHNRAITQITIQVVVLEYMRDVCVCVRV